MAEPAIERRVVDFDHHSREFHEARVAEWAALRQCPVAYNERYGGFWVVSGYEEVAAVSRDEVTFSSRHLLEPEDGIDYLGIAGIPRGRAIPTARDGRSPNRIQAASATITTCMLPSTVASPAPTAPIA